jgi:hypothetical protein
MQEQDQNASCLVTAEPGGRPEEESSRLGVAGGSQDRMRAAILRAAAVLLDMLAWWPEALLAGQTCLAALQVRQGEKRE